LARFLKRSHEFLVFKELLMAHALHYSDANAYQTEHQAAYHAYQILHFGFFLAPLIAGIDKFFHKLVEWDMYLAPFVSRQLHGHDHTFMQVVGVIEIIAAIGVLIKPRFFAYVVSIWLLGIIVNLLLCHQFYDIALRDFGLSLGALALGRLAAEFDHRHAKVVETVETR